MKTPQTQAGTLSVIQLVLLLAGCSFHIPPQDLGQVADQGTSLPNLGPGDMAHHPAADLSRPPDLLMNLCLGKENTRICDTQQGTAGTCDKNEMYQPDRVCDGDGCDTGYCVRPKNARPCSSDANCPSTQTNPATCQVFTNLFNLYGEYCASPPGQAGRLAPCQQHSDCLWNTCYSFPQGMRCLKPCASDNDCDGSTGSCGPATINIEGFNVTVFGCAR